MDPVLDITYIEGYDFIIKRPKWINILEVYWNLIIHPIEDQRIEAELIRTLKKANII